MRKNNVKEKSLVNKKSAVKGEKHTPSHGKRGYPPIQFSDAEVIELGKELIAWLTNEGKHAVHFCEWYIDKGMLACDWDNLTGRVDFAEYYKAARKLLTRNLMMNKDLHQSYGNRYLGMYDKHLDDYEEEKRDKQAKRQAQLQAESNKVVIESVIHGIKKADEE